MQKSDDKIFRCIATTKKFRRCKRIVKKAGSRCFQHKRGSKARRAYSVKKRRKRAAHKPKM